MLSRFILSPTNSLTKIVYFPFQHSVSVPLKKQNGLDWFRTCNRNSPVSKCFVQQSGTHVRNNRLLFRETVLNMYERGSFRSGVGLPGSRVGEHSSRFRALLPFQKGHESVQFPVCSCLFKIRLLWNESHREYFRPSVYESEVENSRGSSLRWRRASPDRNKRYSFDTTPPFFFLASTYRLVASPRFIIQKEGSIFLSFPADQNEDQEEIFPRFIEFIVRHSVQPMHNSILENARQRANAKIR